MTNEAKRVLVAATAVAFSLDLAAPRLLARREDELYVAVLEWRVSERESFGFVASALAQAAGKGGSIALAAASIGRRCRG